MTIPPEQSVTGWLAELRNNDGSEQTVVGNVWNRYFLKLVRTAQKHLRYAETRVEDEEDIALSVLNSLCAGHSSHQSVGVASAGQRRRMPFPCTIRLASKLGEF